MKYELWNNIDCEIKTKVKGRGSKLGSLKNIWCVKYVQLLLVCPKYALQYAQQQMYKNDWYKFITYVTVIIHSSSPFSDFQIKRHLIPKETYSNVLLCIM